MAEIIVEPTALSKVIPLKFKINDVDVPKTTQLSTNKQFNTTDTDAWFTFELDGLAATNGTYDLTLINLDDKSIFHHDNVLFPTLPFHYKLNSSEDVTLNEIRHAGRWLGQLVVTLSNGDTTARQFGFDIAGHILDGQDAQVILLSDYQALINTINLAKDDLAQYSVDYAALLVDIAAAEDARVTAYNQLLADQQANIEAFDVALDDGIVAANLATKLQDFEATNNSRLLSAEQQLAETESELLNRRSDVTKMGIERNVDITAELTQLFANATDGDSFFFPNGEYKIGSLTVDKEINLYSDEATITSIDGTEKHITINSKVCIEGFKFNKVGLYFPYTAENFSNIRKNKFSNVNGIGAIFGETGFNKTPMNVSFIENEFINNTYSFKGGFSYCLFENNRMNNGSGNRNIEINMGQHNTIMNNKIKTGVTGVAFLIDAALSKQISITGNIVKGNDIQGISEEGISFDVFGNNAEKCGTIFSANVLTRLDSGNFQITLDKEFSAFIFINCFLVFLDGVRKGEIFKINDMPYGGSSVLQLESTGGSWDVVGSKVSIIIPFLFNEVSGNTLTDCELAGIVLYGNCIGTIVEKNNLRNSNIQSTKLGGLLGDRPAVSMYNQIRNNNIIDGEIIMDYINYGGVPSPKGYKNEVSDNNFYNSILRIIDDSEELMVQKSNRMINSIELTTY